jgi:hypothetical protein
METITLPNTLPTIKVGAKVSVDDPKFPGVWTIKSIGPKNVVVIPDAGGRGLRCPRWMLKNVDDAAAAVAAQAAPYVAYAAGEVVRVIKQATKTDTDALWVVLVDKGEKINIAKLGGDDNRYLRVPRSWLAKVDLADVLK